MVCFFRACNCANGRRTLVGFLAFAWASGLVLGLITAYFADPAFFVLLDRAAVCSVSTGGYVISLFLPVLLTAVTVLGSCRWLLIPLAFVKAFLLALLSCGTVVAYGSGGWLIAVLLLFSDYLCSAALIWIWLHLIRGYHVSALRSFAVLVVFLAAGFLNFRYISPFLANLLL